MWRGCLLATAIILLHPIECLSAMTYYVTPHDGVPCLEKDAPCFTLTEYAEKPKGYFESSMTVIVLPGNHSLTSNFSMQDFESVSVISNNTSQPDVTITCMNLSRFSFRNISFVEIIGLSFAACGGNSLAIVENFTLENCMITGTGGNTSGTGLYLTKVNAVNITMSTFVSNTGTIIEEEEEEGIVGGAIIGLLSNIYITNTTFERNKANIGGAVYVLGNNYNIVIKNCMFHNNEAHGAADITEPDGGAVFISDSSVEIIDSFFISNTAGVGGSGGAVTIIVTPDIYTGTTVSVEISNCVFHNNSAEYKGGGFYISTISPRLQVFKIKKCVFTQNHASTGAGAYLTYVQYNTILYKDGINFHIRNSEFSHNKARSDGGGLLYVANHQESSLILHKCDFKHNMANGSGGGIWVNFGGFANISTSTFDTNRATFGGAGSFGILLGAATLLDTTFKNNYANISGGAIIANTYMMIPTYDVVHILNLTNSVFEHNTAPKGGAFSIGPHTSLVSSGFLTINENTAYTQVGVVYVFQGKAIFYGDFTFTNNIGPFTAVSSNVTFSGESNFINNTNHCYNCSHSYSVDKFQGGGALTCFQSEVQVVGSKDINFINNSAEYGGSILITESRIRVSGLDSGNVLRVYIADNKASVFGGGIFALQSEISFNADSVIVSGNVAGVKGGGIYMSGTILKLVGGTLQITNNSAINGGGVCLEAYSKLYVIKDYGYNDPRDSKQPSIFELSHNAGHYGGALYISDETDSLICARNSSNNIIANGDYCFIQTLALYTLGDDNSTFQNLHLKNINFMNNTATYAGGAIYGGLLDRCRVSSLAEVYLNYSSEHDVTLSGISYLLNITNLQSEDVSTSITSGPVRVCFCSNGKPDCNYKPPTRFIKKQQQFKLHAVAVDQVNNSIPATIVASLSSQQSVLSEGQSQNATETCTNLNYTISSLQQTETVTLYAVGPCNNYGISKQQFEVKFLPCDYCPVGFKADRYCSCKCAPELNQFVSNCSIDSETLIPKHNIWINYTNQSGYVGHQCPFDYCIRSVVSVNLNLPSGSDIQCTFRRSGTLCGECSTNLTLSLGSSRCISCSNFWLLLIIPFALAGIALVIFLLVCNLTVAIGTINGLVFYANIIGANWSIFVPAILSGSTLLWVQNPLTVFISWINLDLGIETCFYHGMTAYGKTWLQFAFPFYIIFLVILIIKVSRRSPKFARLLTSNPVATLATLILLSYTKILRAIIAALSLATLEFSGNPTFNETNSTHTSMYNRKVWLIDANIDYLEGKHIALFVTAIFLLIVGLIYTFLLLTWQWLYPLLAKSHYLMTSTIIINTNHFMDAYHAPYKPRHRHWAGVLLLVRATLYLVSALNVFGNPRVNLMAIILVMALFYLFQSFIMSNVYKQWSLNFLETTFFINLFLLATITFFISDLDNKEQYTKRYTLQSAVAYTSTSIALVTFIGIIIYHTYTFVCKKCHATVRGKRIHYEPIKNNQNKRKGKLREPLDLIDEDPTAEDYRKAAPERESSPRERKQAVTHTEIEGLP